MELVGCFIHVSKSDSASLSFSEISHSSSSADIDLSIRPNSIVRRGEMKGAKMKKRRAPLLILLIFLLIPLLFLPLCCIMLGFYMIDKMEECQNMIPKVISNKVDKNDLSPGDLIYTLMRGNLPTKIDPIGIYTDLNLETDLVDDFYIFFFIVFFGLIDLICSMGKIILRVESRSKYLQGFLFSAKLKYLTFDVYVNSTVWRPLVLFDDNTLRILWDFFLKDSYVNLRDRCFYSRNSCFDLRASYIFLSHFCRRRLLLLLLPLLFLPLCCIALGFYIIYMIKECKNMIPEVISNKIEIKDLIPGDHIYTWRRGHTYSHHGIYVGAAKVIHLTRAAGNILSSSSRSHPSDNPAGQIRGDQSTYDQVELSDIDSFLSGGDLCLVKYGVSIPFFLAKTRGGTCTLAPSDPPLDVVRRAIYLLEKGFGVYNLSENNCEDFAIYCKTGFLVDDSNCVRRSIGRSGQAASLLAAIVVSISSLLRLSTASFTWLVFVGYAIYCMFRLVSDVSVRRNVHKVEVEELAAALEKFGHVRSRRTLLDVIKPYLVPIIYIILGWLLCEMSWADVIFLYAMFM